MSWRDSIDKALEKEAAQRLAKEQKIKKEAEDIAKLIEEQDRHTKLSWLRENFKCHMCGDKSEKPLEVSGQTENRDGGYDNYHTTVWNKPGDMEMCGKCGRWACIKKHIHNGVCKDCYKKLYRPWWLRWL